MHLLPSKTFRRDVWSCVCASIETFEQVVSESLPEYAGLGYAVCLSSDWRRMCTPYARGIACRYIIYRRYGRFVLLLLASFVPILLLDTVGGYLWLIRELRNATGGERFARQSAK